MRVLNIATNKTDIDENAVYVGRPSVWGNPYIIGKHGTREQVVALYREHLRRSPGLMSRIDELRGRNLVCYCAPLACHADVLLELANRKRD